MEEASIKEEDLTQIAAEGLTQTKEEITQTGTQKEKTIKVDFLIIRIQEPVVLLLVVTQILLDLDLLVLIRLITQDQEELTTIQQTINFKETIQTGRVTKKVGFINCFIKQIQKRKRLVLIFEIFRL